MVGLQRFLPGKPCPPPELLPPYRHSCSYQAKGIPDVMATESIDPRSFDSEVVRQVLPRLLHRVVVHVWQPAIQLFSRHATLLQSSSASETPQTILHKLAVESLLPHPLWAQQTLASFASARQTLQRREKLVETRKDVRPPPGCPMPKSANVKDWLVACFGWADVGPGPVELLDVEVAERAGGAPCTDGFAGAAAGVAAGGAASGAKRRLPLPLSTHEMAVSNGAAVAGGAHGLSALQPPAAKRWRGGQADDGDDGDEDFAGTGTGSSAYDAGGLRQKSGSATPPPAAGSRHPYNALTASNFSASGLGPYVPTSPGATVVMAYSGGGSGTSAGEQGIAPAAGDQAASQMAEAEGEEAAWDEEEAKAWEEGAEGGEDDEEEEDELGLEGLGDVEFHVPVEFLAGAGGPDPFVDGAGASDYPAHPGATGAACAAGGTGDGAAAAAAGLPSRQHGSIGSSSGSDAGLTVPLQSALLSLDQLEANRTLRRLVGWFARRLELLTQAEAGAASAVQRTSAAGNAAPVGVNATGAAVSPQQPQPAAGSVAHAGLGAAPERQRAGAGARLSAVALLRGTMITSALFDTEGAPALHGAAGVGGAAVVVAGAGEVSTNSLAGDGEAGGMPATDSSAAPAINRPDFLAAAAPQAGTTLNQVAAAARGGYLITPAAAAWLYGLLLRLETPLLSDSSAVLRQLFVLCRRTREWLARHPPPPPPPSAAVLAAAGGYCASVGAAGSAAGSAAATAGDAAGGGGAKQAGLVASQRGLHAGLVAAINAIAVVTGTFYAQRLQGED